MRLTVVIVLLAAMFGAIEQEAQGGDVIIKEGGYVGQSLKADRGEVVHQNVKVNEDGTMDVQGKKYLPAETKAQVSVPAMEMQEGVLQRIPTVLLALVAVIVCAWAIRVCFNKFRRIF